MPRNGLDHVLVSHMNLLGKGPLHDRRGFDMPGNGLDHVPLPRINLGEVLLHKRHGIAIDLLETVHLERMSGDCAEVLIQRSLVTGFIDQPLDVVEAVIAMGRVECDEAVLPAGEIRCKSRRSWLVGHPAGFSVSCEMLSINLLAQRRTREELLEGNRAVYGRCQPGLHRLLASPDQRLFDGRPSSTFSPDQRLFFALVVGVLLLVSESVRRLNSSMRLGTVVIAPVVGVSLPVLESVRRLNASVRLRTVVIAPHQRLSIAPIIGVSLPLLESVRRLNASVRLRTVVISRPIIPDTLHRAPRAVVDGLLGLGVAASVSL